MNITAISTIQIYIRKHYSVIHWGSIKWEYPASINWVMDKTITAISSRLIYMEKTKRWLYELYYSICKTNGVSIIRALINPNEKPFNDLSKWLLKLTAKKMKELKPKYQNSLLIRETEETQTAEEKWIFNLLGYSE